jgi:hypothetical protein
MTATGKIVHGMRLIAASVTKAFVEITHNSFALIGVAVIFAAITLTVRPELREAGESHLFGWLQSRQSVASGMDGQAEPEAIERATATSPQNLTKAQAAVAFWLSKKYHVAPEPVSALVSEAYDIGSKTSIDPTLILAVMAVESGFNPFAQSAVGAQGLMQVMTKIHSAKYENFGGKLAAFDPLTNLRVGVKVLQECIARAGSLEAGLRSYVGAGGSEGDGGYAAKVMAEHNRLKQVSSGRTVAPTAPQTAPAVVTPKDEPEEAAKVASLFSSSF